MIDSIEKKDCCGCGACAAVCPAGCIKMKPDGEGFFYPHIESEKCIQCRKCLEVCIRTKERKGCTEQKGYACINHTIETRLRSSSGGIFTMLAEAVLSDHGVVYGAVWGQDFQVIHTRAETMDDVIKMQGSKYPQSSIEHIYLNIKTDLENNKKVLFTGTPCQVNAVRNYLNKEYENLYCQDLVCHGVMSVKVWKKWLDDKKSHFRSEVDSKKGITFRNKDFGWEKYALYIPFSNGKVYRKKYTKDLLMRTYIRNLVQRPSCYCCKNKLERAGGDITLGDFWGISELLPEMNDHKGTSLVLVHTKKGNELFERIKKNMISQEVSVKNAIKYNTCILQSIKEPKERQEFLNQLETRPVGKVFQEFTKIPMQQRIRNKGIWFISGLKRKVFYRLWRKN